VARDLIEALEKGRLRGSASHRKKGKKCHTDQTMGKSKSSPNFEKKTTHRKETPGLMLMEEKNKGKRENQPSERDIPKKASIERESSGGGGRNQRDVIGTAHV